SVINFYICVLKYFIKISIFLFRYSRAISRRLALNSILAYKKVTDGPYKTAYFIQLFQNTSKKLCSNTFYSFKTNQGKKMNKVFALSSTVAVALALTACASNPTTSLAIQKQNNQYEVTGVGKSNLISKNNAITAANNTCGKKATAV